MMRERIMPCMKIDLPEPVEPETSICGKSLRSAETTFASIDLPNGMKRLAFSPVGIASIVSLNGTID